MKPSRIRDIFLTAVGWTALLLYILACRPSWSPDGTKLLFPYYDGRRDEVGVAVFDRTTGNVRKVFVKPNTAHDIVPVQWSADGKYALLSVKSREILFLPVDSTEPARTLSMPEGAELNVFPIPNVDGNLYISGDSIAKIDLATEEVTLQEVDDPPLLFQSGNEVAYLTQTHNEVPSEDRIILEPNGYEYGRVHKETLALQPWFRIAQEVLDRYDIDELGFAAHAPDGRRFAIVGLSEGATPLLLCDESGVRRVLTHISSDGYVLGNIEWSPKQDILFASALVPRFGKDESDLFVAEIALDGSPPRLIPLGTIEEEVDEEDVWLVTLALSLDGTTIAASTAHNDKRSLPDAAHGVFIVNLEDPERRVTKIPMSSWIR